MPCALRSRHLIAPAALHNYFLTTQKFLNNGLRAIRDGGAASGGTPRLLWFRAEVES